MNDLLKIKKNLNLRRRYWTVIIILVGSFYFSIIEDRLSYLTQIREIKLWIAIISVLTIYSLIVYFLLSPLENLKKEKIHNQGSWVFYYYFCLIFAPLTSYLLNTYMYDQLCDRYLLFCFKTISNHLFIYQTVEEIFNLTIRFLILSVGLLYYFKIKGEIPDDKSLRFAPNSAGLKDDQLDFAIAAGNAANGISKLKDYISVAAVYGDMGYGKSSLTRMVIESLNENHNRNKIMYTYISLTETNVAKDFSLLFSERWLESIEERYPKISVLDGSQLLSTILRDTGNGIISEMLLFLTKFNKGLYKTKAKAFDLLIDKKRKHVPSFVSQLFASIPEFKEIMWVITIDEIERAKLDEIYRVIEVIERFKYECRSGIPVRLVFLLCMSRKDVLNLLDSNNVSDTDKGIAIHIKNFLFDDPKNITISLNLPPVNFKNKLKYVVNLIDEFIKEYAIKEDIRINTYQVNSLFNPEGKHQITNTDVMEYALGLLVYDSPRVVQRTIQELQLFYSTFRNSLGVKRKDYIRFPDILLATYARVRYPYLIEFLTKTLNVFNLDLSDPAGLDLYLKKDEFEKQKKTIPDWITEVTGHKFQSNQEKLIIETIIGCIANDYFDFIHNRPKSYDFLWKQESLSKSENLKDYLSFVASEPDMPSRRAYETYLKHIRKLNKKFLKSMQNNYLIDYSRFVRSINDTNVKVNFEIAFELLDRFMKSKLPVQKYTIGTDTLLNEATYEFLFNILEVSEKDTNLEGNQEVHNLYLAAVKMIKVFLESKAIGTGFKYMMLNAVVNTERGQGSEIYFRLNTLSHKITTEGILDFKQETKFVVNETYERYLDGKKDIYIFEENFFYVLYQTWTGNAEDNLQINKIRETVKRNLNKHKDALKLYWGILPYRSTWSNVDQLIKSRDIFPIDNNLELYITVETLVSISQKVRFKDRELDEKINWWKNIVNSPTELKKYKEWMQIKSKDDTFMSFLLRHEIIQRQGISSV